MQPIERLDNLSDPPLAGVDFFEVSPGCYRAEANGFMASPQAVALRLLLSSGSIIFTPFDDSFGDYAEGMIVTVLTEEKAGKSYSCFQTDLTIIDCRFRRSRSE